MNSELNAESRRCNCKGGKCRQLYCVCLKRGEKCIPGVCQCQDCQNDDREAAVQARLEQKRSLDSAVRKGCNCKKNYCKKNYCICHNDGLWCDPAICHCTECYNHESAGPLPLRQSSDSLKASDGKKRKKNDSLAAAPRHKVIQSGE